MSYKDYWREWTLLIFSLESTYTYSPKIENLLEHGSRINQSEDMLHIANWIWMLHLNINKITTGEKMGMATGWFGVGFGGSKVVLIPLGIQITKPSLLYHLHEPVQCWLQTANVTNAI